MDLSQYRSGEKIECVLSDEVQQIRRIIRLYKELGVNKEGIDIILAMRNQILEMHKEMAMLQQKLDRLENDHKLRYWEIPREMGLIIDYEDQWNMALYVIIRKLHNQLKLGKVERLILGCIQTVEDYN